MGKFDKTFGGGTLLLEGSGCVWRTRSPSTSSVSWTSNSVLQFFSLCSQSSVPKNKVCLSVVFFISVDYNNLVNKFPQL